MVMSRVWQNYRGADLLSRAVKEAPAVSTRWLEPARLMLRGGGLSP